MANSVSVAVGDRDTTHWGGWVRAEAPDAPARGTTSAARARTSRDRRDVTRFMDISFPSKGGGRRMDIRTTAPDLESCLSRLLAAGDLARGPEGSLTVAGQRWNLTNFAAARHPDLTSRPQRAATPALSGPAGASASRAAATRRPDSRRSRRVA